ncbi:MAG: nitrogenase iron-molybdenum cofactor biosynthesis protein NifN [Alphaproteobacteria bacterium]|nr:nitrogenase iron-molybdenum cofactor biosynthesis protein NifN [Alphaproteobacteria bacterium]
MVEIVKRAKALSVNPLKSSQTIGAALAFLGVARAIPMLHGSQGCTAFGKVFFVRHFREPIPLQTTAMDQVSTVMGAGDSVVEGLATICSKSSPAFIGIPTTGLSETQGADVRMAVKEFRAKHPEFITTEVVPVNTPDYTGCLETGFAKAVTEIIEKLVEAAPRAVDADRVNILSGAHLTPGDVEAVKDMVEMFGLRPVVIPDLSGSLDGHLPDNDFNPLTTGGVSVDDIRTAGAARATLVIGRHLDTAADGLKSITGVTDWRFDHLFGLDAVDAFVKTLTEISGRSVPARVKRQRAQLQDAMLDSHFMIGQTRLALAGDPEVIKMFADLGVSMGAEVVACVAPTRSPVLEDLPLDAVKIGDLEDLEKLAKDAGAELLIGNSHCVQSAARLGVPVLRAGFPQFDVLGGFRRTWMGYAGTRDALFEIANLMLSVEKGEVEHYASIYAQRPGEEDAHGHRSPSSHSGLRH